MRPLAKDAGNMVVYFYRSTTYMTPPSMIYLYKSQIIKEWIMFGAAQWDMYGLELLNQLFIFLVWIAFKIV